MRNRGTIGGNVCSNDPTNHLPPLLAALGAEFTIQGAEGDRTIPAHREAYARVTKAHVTTGQLGGVYEAVEQWIGANGHAVARAPRETYWTDFMDAKDDDEVFDVAFPVT